MWLLAPLTDHAHALLNDEHESESHQADGNEVGDVYANFAHFGFSSFVVNYGGGAGIKC